MPTTKEESTPCTIIPAVVKQYRVQIKSAFIDIEGTNFRDAVGRLVREYPNVGRLVIRRVEADNA